MTSKVVILGTGGTIAGVQDDPQRAWQYQAAQLAVAQLAAAMPDLADTPLETHQVAQIDSKDMSWPVWQALGQALGQHLSRDDVAAAVITHGTDTLEETAYLLHKLLDVNKPVVLTAAMRPATAPDADGPANLRDAVRVAQTAAAEGRAGVVAVMGRKVWPSAQVRKAHTSRIDAFDGGGSLPLAELDESGRVVGTMSEWPAPEALGWAILAGARPPRVEIVTSHADADGWVVDALLAHAAAAGGVLDGLVVAATGHGTLHQGLEASLQRAREQGVAVWRASRVARGGVQPRLGDTWPAAGGLTAAQARVALMLELAGSA